MYVHYSVVNLSNIGSVGSDSIILYWLMSMIFTHYLEIYTCKVIPVETCCSRQMFLLLESVCYSAYLLLGDSNKLRNFNSIETRSSLYFDVMWSFYPPSIRARSLVETKLLTNIFPSLLLVVIDLPTIISTREYLTYCIRTKVIQIEELEKTLFLYIFESLDRMTTESNVTSDIQIWRSVDYRRYQTMFSTTYIFKKEAAVIAMWIEETVILLLWIL